MKFKVQKTLKECSLARLGLLNLASDESELVTPTCTIYTIGGTVPNISNDLLNLLPNKPRLLELPLPSLVKNFELLKKSSLKLNDFINIKNYKTLLTTQDCVNPLKQSTDEGRTVSIWGKNGKLTINTNLFNDIVNTYNTDLVECAYDGVTPKDCSRKRVLKSIERTKVFVENLFLEENEDVKKNTEHILMPVIGGHEMKNRSVYLQYLLKNKFNFNGVTYQGLQPEDSSKQVDDFNFDSISELVKLTNDELEMSNEEKKELLRVCLLVWRPDNVVKGVEAGIDVFSGSYPHVLTQRFEASTFDIVMPHDETTKDETDDENESNQPATKKRKTKRDSSVTIKVDQKEFRDQFEPIRDDCDCYTCSKYTKAYINHLLVNQELIGRTLLMIHNSTHYYNFFEEMRKSMESNIFHKYKNFITRQFSNLK